jgi:sugar phosphate permease
MHARSANNNQYRALRPQLLMCMVIGYAAFYLTRKSVNYVLRRCKRIWVWIKAISACWGRCFT